jgi:hypothetical protein
MTNKKGDGGVFYVNSENNVINLTKISFQNNLAESVIFLFCISMKLF